jgi:hypothetical protein
MDEQTRIDQLERRVDELEERRSTMDRSRAAMDSMVPPKTRQHLRAAGREQLLAVRSLLDHWIGRLRDDGESKEKQDAGRENIRID